MRVMPSKLSLVALALALVALASACGGRAGSDSAPQDERAAAQKSPAQANSGGADAAAPADAAKLDAEIERLEKQTERNPSDEATLHELARAYVRRGDARRGAGQMREALADYQRALRFDPDNAEAQGNAAAAREQLGGEQQGENGEPAPLPITPNIAGEDASPTPTPKKP